MSSSAGCLACIAPPPSGAARRHNLEVPARSRGTVCVCVGFLDARMGGKPRGPSLHRIASHRPEARPGPPPASSHPRHKRVNLDIMALDCRSPQDNAQGEKYIAPVFPLSPTIINHLKPFRTAYAASQTSLQHRATPSFTLI